MKMFGLKYLLFFLLIVSISGCGHVISKETRKDSDPSLTLRQVSQNPNAYQGKRVIWGGEIIDIIQQEGGTSQIEVYQRPLGWRGAPMDTVPSEGRFLVLADQYLDPYLYQGGKKITVAGELIGETIQSVGEMDYRYPLLSSKQIYLWPEYYYYRYAYDYYDPWLYGPYSPGLWRGVGFHYRHHHHHHPHRRR